MIHTFHNRQKKSNAESVTKRMKADLHELTQLIQSPKELKDGVKKMYTKYMAEEKEDVEGNGLESDIQVLIFLYHLLACSSF